MQFSSLFVTSFCSGMFAHFPAHALPRDTCSVDSNIRVSITNLLYAFR